MLLADRLSAAANSSNSSTTFVSRLYAFTIRGCCLIRFVVAIMPVVLLNAKLAASILFPYSA